MDNIEIDGQLEVEEKWEDGFFVGIYHVDASGLKKSNKISGGRYFYSTAVGSLSGQLPKLNLENSVLRADSIRYLGSGRGLLRLAVFR